MINIIILNNTSSHHSDTRITSDKVSYIDKAKILGIWL